MSDRECILEKLSHDFGLNCDGDSEQGNCRRSFPAVFPESQLNHLSVHLSQLEMELPEISKRSTEQRKLSEDSDSSAKIAKGIFPIYKRVEKPSRTLQANQGLSRIIFRNVGGIQNALLQSDLQKPGVSSGGRNLVPFEIREQIGTTNVSSNLVRKEPMLTIRDGFVTAGKMERAHNAAVVVQSDRRLVKMLNFKHLQPVQKVLDGGDNSEIQTDTQLSRFSTVKCLIPHSSMTNAFYPSKTSRSEIDHFSSSDMAERTIQKGECHRKRANANIDHSYSNSSLDSSLEQNCSEYKTETKPQQTEFACGIDSNNVVWSRTVSTPMPKEGKRNGIILQVASNQPDNLASYESSRSSEEGTLYSSDDELTKIQDLIRKAKDCNINKNLSNSSSSFKIPLKTCRSIGIADGSVDAGTQAVKKKSRLSSPKNPVKKSSPENMLRKHNNDRRLKKCKTVGKKGKSTRDILSPGWEMPGLIKKTFLKVSDKSSGELDGGVDNDKALQSALYSALNTQSKISTTRIEKFSKNSKLKSRSGPFKKLVKPIPDPVVNDLSKPNSPVQPYVDEMYHDMLPKTQAVADKQGSPVSSTVPKRLSLFENSKMAQKHDVTDYQRKVLLVSGEHSSRTLGLCDVELSMRKKREESSDDCTTSHRKTKLTGEAGLGQTSGSIAPSSLPDLIPSSDKIEPLDGASPGVSAVVARHCSEAESSDDEVTDPLSAEDESVKSREKSIKTDSNSNFGENQREYQLQDKRGKFRCPFCRKSIYTRKLFVAHIHTHIIHDIFPCPTCGRSYSTSTGLETHLVVHDMHKMVKDSQFRCQLCNRKFKYAVSFEKHMFQHASSTTGPFSCEKCDFCSVTLSKLHQHIKFSHSEDRKYKCKSCARLYLVEENFLDHIKIHSDANSQAYPSQAEFPCEFCDKIFLKKNTYAKHVRAKHVKQSPLQNSWKPDKFVDTKLEPAQSLTQKTRDSSDENENPVLDSEPVVQNNKVFSEVAETSSSLNVIARPTLDDDVQLHTAHDENVISTPQSSEEQIAGVETRQETKQILADVEASLQSALPVDNDSESNTEGHRKNVKLKKSHRNNKKDLTQKQILADVEASLQSALPVDNDSDTEGHRKNVKLKKSHRNSKKDSAQKKAKKGPSLKRSKSDEKKTKKKKYRSFSFEVQVDCDSNPTDAPAKMIAPLDDEPRVEIRYGQCVLPVSQSEKSSTEINAEENDNHEEGANLESLQDSASLSGSQTNITSSTPFLCEVCSKTFTTVESFQKHLIDHLEENPFAIEARNAMEHLREKHGANIDCSVKISAVDIFECGKCNKMFSSEEIFEKHKTEHEEKKVEGSTKTLTEVNTKEPDDALNDIEKYYTKHSNDMGMFSCPNCLLHFTDKAYLEKHIDIYHASGRCNLRQRKKKKVDPSSEYTCEVCGQQCRSSRSFKVHQDNHKRSYFCTICGMIVTLLSNVKRHVECHFENGSREIRDIPRKAVRRRCVSGVDDGPPKKRGRKKKKVEC